VNSTRQPLSYLRPLLQADLLILLRNRRVVLVSVLLPLLLLFVSAQKSPPGHASSALVVLAITLGLLSLSIIGYASGLARDRERGVFQRLRVTPAPTWTIMVSRLLVQIVVGLLIAIVVLTIGASIGHISLDARQYLYAVLVAMLACVVFLSIGQALVGLVKSAAMVHGLGTVLFVTLALSGLWGFAGTMGSGFQAYARWTPVGTVITVFQGAVHEVAWTGYTTMSLLVCIAYIAVCLTLGIKWFSWEAR
jgi:ABC-2 type transport system permease protein